MFRSVKTVLSRQPQGHVQTTSEQQFPVNPRHDGFVSCTEVITQAFAEKSRLILTLLFTGYWITS